MMYDSGAAHTPDRRLVVLGLAGSLAMLSAGRSNAQSGGAPLKIGIVGSGHIGSTVGTLWVKAGHEVLFSSRHPEALKPLVDSLGDRAKAGTVEDAVAFGPVVFLAVPYAAIPGLGRDVGKALAGKIVLDACNPVAGRDGDIVEEAKTNGVGVTTAKYLPGARVVRAFNALNYKVMASESHRPGEPLGLPIAGDDPEAVRIASQLVRDAGLEPVAVPLARANEFAPGGPAYVKNMSVSALRETLGVKS